MKSHAKSRVEVFGMIRNHSVRPYRAWQYWVNYYRSQIVVLSIFIFVL